MTEDVQGFMRTITYTLTKIDNIIFGKDRDILFRCYLA